MASGSQSLSQRSKSRRLSACRSMRRTSWPARRAASAASSSPSGSRRRKTLVYISGPGWTARSFIRAHLSLANHRLRTAETLWQGLSAFALWQILEARYLLLAFRLRQQAATTSPCPEHGGVDDGLRSTAKRTAPEDLRRAHALASPEKS